MSLHASAVSLRLESEAALLPQLASAQRRLDAWRLLNKKNQPAVSNRSWVLLRKMLEPNLPGRHFTHKLGKRLNDTVPNSAATGETLGDRILIGISRNELTPSHCAQLQFNIGATLTFTTVQCTLVECHLSRRQWNPSRHYAHDNPMEIDALDKERRRNVPVATAKRTARTPVKAKARAKEKAKRKYDALALRNTWTCALQDSSALAV